MIINEIFENSKNYNCTITFPEDVAIGKTINDTSQIKELKDIEKDDLILDIGPRTISKNKNIIELSKTILWNGPAGYFENPNFAIGSSKLQNQSLEKIKINQFTLSLEVAKL